jgi:acetyl esterase/lipase
MPIPSRLLAVFLFTAAVGLAADAYPPTFEGARAEVYKEVGDVKLALYIFEPASGPKTSRPAIVFFFGGGWTNGNPRQFEQHCRHLAARGMVAITADYRVASRHGVKPVTCVADAKSAIRWVRQHASRLGIDPNRVAAGGGSAGGHLAAAAATLSGFDEPGEDRSLSAIPNALVLFNPALVMAPMAGVALEGFGARVSAERMGTNPINLSPAHHVKNGAPPAIIFHGRADTTVPYATAEAFARVMQQAGSRCELVGFDDQTHGFFNYGRDDNRNYRATLAATDAFLVSLGYLAKTRSE